jgi:integrase
VAKSTTKRRTRKAAKILSAGFPLWKHPSGRWCKKVRGRAHYFGKVASDPDGEKALEEWLRVKDDLLAGRTPRPKGDGLTVRALVNRFLTEKLGLLDSGELSRRAWEDYYRSCERIISVFGRTRPVIDLAAEDFSRLRQDFAKTHGSWAMARDITHTRTIFKFGYEAGLLNQPVRYGPMFKRPPARKFRAERSDKGPKMFEAAEVRKLLGAADQPMKAMILLAANCGFGNADIGGLELRHLDMETGWINFPRVKTGIERRCPLWPETVKALQEWVTLRPKPKPRGNGLDQLAFLTAKGNPWIDRPSAKNPTQKIGDREVEKLQGDRPVSKEFSKLLATCKLKRSGRGFYALRHTFQTIGDETGDFVAVRKLMGHAFGGDISDMYRERISDERLHAVTGHVRRWLFGNALTNGTVEDETKKT